MTAKPKHLFSALLALLLVWPAPVFAQTEQVELDASKIDKDTVDRDLLEGKVLEAQYLDPKQPLPDGPAQAMKFSVPEGTTFAVALNTELDSNESVVGDRFQVVLKTPLLSPAGYVVLPVGSRLTGEIKDVAQARMPRVEARMRVVFYEAVTPDEEIIPVEASADTGDGYLMGNRRSGRLKTAAVNSAIRQTVVMTAGSVAGYGAGAALFVLAKKGKEVMFRPGDEMYLKLDKPIQYNPNPIFRAVSGSEQYNFLNIAPEEVPVQFPRLILDSSSN